MNLQELRTKILYLLNEDPSNPVYFTASDVNATINEALEIISEEAKDIRREAFLVLRPGTFLYTLHDLGPTAMTPLRMWDVSDERRLDVTTMTTLNGVRQDWFLTTSERPDVWFPVGHDCFGVYPAPVTGGTILRVQYAAWPLPLVYDEDTSEYREVDEDLVTLYGQYNGMVEQWEAERALDLFIDFASGWKDQAAKNETRKLKNSHFNRGSNGERDTSI